MKEAEYIALANLELRYLRCLLLGDSGVGKTSLSATYGLGKFPDFIPGVCEPHSRHILAGFEAVNMEIFDIGGGGEDSHRLRPLSYPKTDVFLLCFAVDSRDSFLGINHNAKSTYSLILSFVYQVKRGLL